MPPRPSAAELSSGARLDAVAYCIHFVGGVAMLAPWNAMLTAGDYFDAVLAPHPVARLTTAAYLPPTLVLALALLGRHEVTRPRARIVGSFVAFAVLVLVLVAVDATVGSSVAAVLTVAAAIGAFDGLAQPALYGEAALLPSPYTQAVVAGTAASGVVTSLLRVVTKAALPSAAGGGRASICAFFGTAAAACVAAAAAYWWALPRTAVWRVLSDGHVEGECEEGGHGANRSGNDRIFFLFTAVYRGTREAGLPLNTPARPGADPGGGGGGL